MKEMKKVEPISERDFLSGYKFSENRESSWTAERAGLKWKAMMIKVEKKSRECK